MLGEAAVCLAQDAARTRNEGGFWTPSVCMGDALLVNPYDAEGTAAQVLHRGLPLAGRHALELGQHLGFHAREHVLQDGRHAAGDGAVRVGLLAQREERQRHGQHAVDAHHRGVAVVGRESGADLVVRHDRQVDQEPEDAGAEEVPEPDRDEEHDRPAVRKRRRGLGLLVGAELQEAPRLDGQERQRDHLER